MIKMYLLCLTLVFTVKYLLATIAGIAFHFAQKSFHTTQITIVLISFSIDLSLVSSISCITVSFVRAMPRNLNKYLYAMATMSMISIVSNCIAILLLCVL